ncbi:MAG: Grx4 family monothiol glutaredoxin [Alphaproteobacteria bacterium]|jgi:monothiol glutaredoxin
MTDNPAHDQIKEEVTSNDVVLFMKGTPVFPQCGFSSTVVQVLSLMGAKFKGIDVLANAEIREGIKSFSSWPTIPQLYVKGEFIGGCDIIREMYESGELHQVMTEKGISITAPEGAPEAE